MIRLDVAALLAAALTNACLVGWLLTQPGAFTAILGG